MEVIISVLTGLLTSVPLYLLWLVGIVLALVRMREHPNRYRLVAISLAIMLVVSVVITGFNLSIPFVMQQYARTFEEMSNTLMVVNIIGQIVTCVAWVLLLVALFARDAKAAVPAEVRHSDGSVGF